MKKIFITASTLFAFAVFANAQIKLTKGQKITAQATNNSNSDMGMGMEMKSNSSNTVSIDVVGENNDKSYNVSATITKMVVSMDMLGQQMNFDSDKQEDKDSELGKELTPMLNAPDTMLVDKATGSIDRIKKNESPDAKDDINPLEGMMKGVGGNIQTETILAGAFFILPKDKKTGDSWSDSTTLNNMKTVRTYKINAIEKNIATILLTTTLTGSGETEMQGTPVNFTINTISTGEMIVDTKTSKVSKTTTDINMTGSFDVMGQSMPITSKGKSTVIYQ